MAQVLKDEIRQCILDSALEEFFIHGYVRTTIRDIAGRAGIPAGLIYSEFISSIILFRVQMKN